MPPVITYESDLEDFLSDIRMMHASYLHFLFLGEIRSEMVKRTERQVAGLAKLAKKIEGALKIAKEYDL